MPKIKKLKNPYCDCRVYESERIVSGRKMGKVIFSFHENCTWGVQENIRISIFDEKGQVKETFSW